MTALAILAGITAAWAFINVMVAWPLIDLLLQEVGE